MTKTLSTLPGTALNQRKSKRLCMRIAIHHGFCAGGSVDLVKSDGSFSGKRAPAVT